MQIHVRDAAPAYQTKDTSIIREIVHPAASAARLQSLAEATLPPGATTQAHYHPRSEELYYILAGAGLIAIEHEQAELRPGDAVVIPPAARHQIRNTGEVDLVFLCCCSPAYAHEDTILCDSLF